VQAEGGHVWFRLDRRALSIVDLEAIAGSVADLDARRLSFGDDIATEQ
jgi:hypothetical protein